MVEATRCNTSSVAIDSLRILEHGFDDAPGVAFEPLKKAAVTTGMTGDSALLFHDQQNGVVVAVEPDLAHPLYVTGALALAPQPPARTRPVVRDAGRLCRRQRFPVHPRQSQRGAGLRFLRNRRNQSIFIPLYIVEPAHGVARISIPAAAIAALASPTVCSP